VFPQSQEPMECPAAAERVSGSLCKGGQSPSTAARARPGWSPRNGHQSRAARRQDPSSRAACRPIGVLMISWMRAGERNRIFNVRGRPSMNLEVWASTSPARAFLQGRAVPLWRIRAKPAAQRGAGATPTAEGLSAVVGGRENTVPVVGSHRRRRSRLGISHARSRRRWPITSRWSASPGPAGCRAGKRLKRQHRLLDVLQRGLGSSVRPSLSEGVAGHQQAGDLASALPCLGHETAP